MPLVTIGRQYFKQNPDIHNEYYKVYNVTSEVYLGHEEEYYYLDYVLDESEEYDAEKEYYWLNEQSGKVTGKLPEYKIDSYYSASKTNNTVRCEYLLNDIVYVTEKQFTFGPSGTMGTDQTIIIDFVGDKNAIDEEDETC
jgi:hypothetical protein